ncbi:MAG: chromosomal replication initiator protein DnaA [Eubacteriales bacterium]|nr:chromosomal replication initiator protein DnaA [Eubacteriales bacterium]
MDANNIWANACTLLRNEMAEVTYKTWIESALSPIDILKDDFYIEAVTDYYHQFVSSRYEPMISDALSKTLGRSIKVNILTPKQAEEFKLGKRQSAKNVNAQLNPKYTFDSFVVGSGNRFAHAASLAVAEQPASAYNPLFLYGGVGLGKTHLMHAIGHYILSQKPDTNLVYSTSEQFTTELVSAIQSNRNVQFREKYRNVDILLIDDIQFIAGRDSTQEEFFHTFNALHNAGKQIVITSDRPPKEIAKLEERLRSRFEWGLIADIQRPDIDTRVAILREKTKETNLDISDEVLGLIAQKVNSNIRELEGTLTRLAAYAALNKTLTITMELAEKALQDVFKEQENYIVTCDDIINAVGEYYAVSQEDLCGPKRSRSIAVPRQVVMYLCRDLTNCSLPGIGQLLGNRDHSTVLHGCRRIEELMESTPTIRAAVEDIGKQLKKY